MVTSYSEKKNVPYHLGGVRVEQGQATSTQKESKSI